MAGCHRGLHGLRCAQLLLRTTTTGLLLSVSRFGNALPHPELGSSSHSSFSGFSSSYCWNGVFSSFSQVEQRSGSSTSGECGWSAWRHLVERSVHSTSCREDDDKDDGFPRDKGCDAVEISESNGAGDKDAAGAKVAKTEVRDLVQHVHVSFLTQKLRHDSRDTISYQELLELCRSVGMAPSDEDATRMVDVLNQAGVVLIFRDKVHLHPDKIVELVANVLPLSLLGEDDQRRMELMALAQKKEEIDRKAHKQMRLVLWSGLFSLTFQVLIFFRLTFWDLSWDVMEPIAFFTTATGIICGYAYFMFTSRDPSYQDLMQRIFQSRQQKLFKLQNFDYERFKELQMQCQTPITRRKILENPGRK